MRFCNASPFQPSQTDKPSFELLFEKCVERTLKKMVGNSAAKAILYHVGRSNMEKPEKLAKALSKIFGSGALMIEEQIVKVLYGELGLHFIKKEDYTFAQYVQEAEELKHLQK